MNTIEGVVIDFDSIRIFDPATGEDLAQWTLDDWNVDTDIVLEVAVAIRTFYVEGADGVRRLLKGRPK